MSLAPEPGVGKPTVATSMKVTVGSETYDWDGEYTFQEGVAVEKLTGRSFLEWLEEMKPADPKAEKISKPHEITNIAIMLWLIVRRAQPGLAFEDFNPPLDQWSMATDEVDPTPAGPSLTGDATT